MSSNSRIRGVYFDIGDTILREVSEHIWGYPNVEPLPGAGKVLGTLKKNDYKIGAITNTTISREADVRKALREVALEHFFDIVVTSIDVGFEKPDEHIFRVALEGLGLEASESVMVGNRMLTDIVGGKRAGMKTILLVWNDKYAHERDLVVAENPTVTVKSLFEIPEALKHL